MNEKYRSVWLDGYNAKLAYENPHWKKYPNKSTEEDEWMARLWVDGYVRRIIDDRDGVHSDLP